MFEHAKQVESGHYRFSQYMSKERWASIWHQLDEVQKLSPTDVLEIGPGPGLFKTLAANIGIKVETLDIDPDIGPDHVGSISAMPFNDGDYDVVCAFQVLEHLEYDVSLKAFSEMVRVSRRFVVISLPDSREVWRYLLHIPKLGPRSFAIPRPRFRSLKHEFDGEHYWEINKRGYELSKVLADLTAKISLVRTFRVEQNPNHRFFIFQK